MVYLHAGLIYERWPATSDKSLTPRHYLFDFALARSQVRARLRRSERAHSHGLHVSFKTSRENDTSAMNIKRTPTSATCRHRHSGRLGYYTRPCSHARSTLTPTRTSTGTRERGGARRGMGVAGVQA